VRPQKGNANPRDALPRIVARLRQSRHMGNGGIYAPRVDLTKIASFSKEAAETVL